MPQVHWIDDLTLSISMSKPRKDSFGARLAALRMTRGMTQDELGTAAGTSQRMVAHYENTPGAQPPADVLAALARALDGLLRPQAATPPPQGKKGGNQPQTNQVTA